MCEMKDTFFIFGRVCEKLLKVKRKNWVYYDLVDTVSFFFLFCLGNESCVKSNGFILKTSFNSFLIFFSWICDL